MNHLSSIRFGTSPILRRANCFSLKTALYGIETPDVKGSRSHDVGEAARGSVTTKPFQTDPWTCRRRRAARRRLVLPGRSFPSIPAQAANSFAAQTGGF